jgi:pilus assembly protein CpaC
MKSIRVIDQKKVIAILSASLVFALSLTAFAQEDVSTIDAFTGQSVIIPVESPDSVLIDRRDVLDYLPNLPATETRLILRALTNGEANVEVEKDGQKTVYKVVVSNPDQLDQIAVIKRVVGDPSLEVIFLEDDRVILEGEMENDLSYRRALDVASALTPNVLNFMTVKNPMQIRIKTQVVEVNVTKAKEIGMQYRATAAGDPDAGLSGLAGAIPLGISTISTAPYFTAINQVAGNDFGALLSFAQNNNVARVLQEPTLTVLNGQSAIFRVGGEVPIITTNVDDGVITENVAYRPFGISMLVTPILEGGESTNTFYNNTGQSGPNQTKTVRDSRNIPELSRPTVFENGIIRLFVRPEISNVDFTQTFGLNEAPLFTTRYVESRVALQDGQPLVIGGLYDENTANRLQEVPFLSKIPVLGELFKHRRNTDDRLELIFVLTPTLVGREEARNDLANYPITQGEMERYLMSKDFNRITVKPTRISANDVLVRTGDMVPVVRDLRMMEEAQGIQMQGTFEQESVRSEGATIADFEKPLPDEGQPSISTYPVETEVQVKPSQGVPELQPRPSE